MEKIQIKISDTETKEFTPDELQGYVANLIKQQASATQLTQEYAPLKKLCDAYKAKPEDVALQADALFKKVTKWQDDGFLDDNFEIASRQRPSQRSDDDDETNLDDLLAKHKTGNSFNSEDVTKLANKAIEDAKAPLLQKINKLEQGIEMLSNFHIEGKLKEKYPALEGEDIARAMHMARTDSSKNLLQHAEDIATQKQTKMGELEKQFAQKYGVDIDKYNENKLNQQSADGGVLPMFKGKRIALSDRRKGEDGVTARDAMMAHFQAKEAAVQGG